MVLLCVLVIETEGQIRLTVNEGGNQEELLH